MYELLSTTLEGLGQTDMRLLELLLALAGETHPGSELHCFYARRCVRVCVCLTLVWSSKLFFFFLRQLALSPNHCPGSRPPRPGISLDTPVPSPPHTHTHARTHTCTHPHAHRYVDAAVSAGDGGDPMAMMGGGPAKHAEGLRTKVGIYTHAHIHAHTHTHTHGHTHARTRARTHTRTQAYTARYGKLSKKVVGAIVAARARMDEEEDLE
jgi:hypothetical protein